MAGKRPSHQSFPGNRPPIQRAVPQKKAAAPLTHQGLVALDGRFLNFAPQCSGWHHVTQKGGSGSFLIFWSGLWKLTTAAAIPYHTGRYGNHPRGFGYVTIGANVHEFHRPAMETANKIKSIRNEYMGDLREQTRKNEEQMAKSLKKTATDLTFYTLVMIAAVILIAIWIAPTITRKITAITKGIERFQKGEMDHRLEKNPTTKWGCWSNRSTIWRTTSNNMWRP